MVEEVWSRGERGTLETQKRGIGYSSSIQTCAVITIVGSVPFAYTVKIHYISIYIK